MTQEADSAAEAPGRVQDPLRVGQRRPPEWLSAKLRLEETVGS